MGGRDGRPIIFLIFLGAGESIIDFIWGPFQGVRFLGLQFLTSDRPLDGPHKPNPKTEP